MNEVLKTISERSSIRAYTQEKLTQEQIEALVIAGLQAPTARNEQEVHISVIDGDHAILQEIEQAKREYLASIVPEAQREAVLNVPVNFYYSAPTVFILSAKTDFAWSKLDAGIAVENMALAAKSMGLGSVIIGIIQGAMNSEKKEYFAKVCDFPEGYEYAIALAVGYPNTEKACHDIDMDANVSYIK